MCFLCPLDLGKWRYSSLPIHLDRALVLLRPNSCPKSVSNMAASETTCLEGLCSISLVPTIPLPLPHPDWPPPRLPLPHPDYPCKTLRECANGVWIKYWALDIINDKWSNCGSDDSSCKYWRKNLYNFILIIFLLFHITKWTAHAWVLGAQTSSHAPYYILGWRQICFILFIHHYVIMNLII